MPPQLEKDPQERKILWIFDLGLVLKGVNGGVEVLAAGIIAFLPPHLIASLVNVATAGELLEDPNDLAVAAIKFAAHVLSVSNHFLIALYLLLHGGIKVALVIGIFKGKRIAYPLFMLALLIFGAYELYLGFLRHDLLLTALGSLDFMLLIVTLHEYERRYGPVSARKGGHSASQ